MILRTVIISVIPTLLVTAISAGRENNIQIFRIISWKKIFEQKHSLTKCKKSVDSQCLTFSENQIKACFINDNLQEIRL